MIQLAFDNEFKKIIDSTPTYWKEVDDIPFKVIQYMKKYSELFLISELSTGNNYCNKCLKELDKDFYCSSCNNSFKESINKDRCVYITEMSSLKFRTLDFYYYVFDIDKESNDVVLYVIKDEKYLFDGGYTPKLISKLKIFKAYYITKTYIRELLKDEFIYYSDLDKIKPNDEIDEDSEELEKMVNPLYNEYSIFAGSSLYRENLKELSTTVYKYSNIWNNQLICEDFYNLNLKELVYLPIHFPQFELLTKLNLDVLAIQCNKLPNKNNTFQGVLGVGKEYLSFMQENEICLAQLEALKRCKKCDIDLVNFVDSGLHWFKEIEKIIPVNYEKIKEYFDFSGLHQQYISEYCDYLEMAYNLGFDMKDSKVLYPKDLLEEHDKLFARIKIINDQDIDKRINSLSSALRFNVYEDDKYLIFPATSINSMIEESNQQRNCLKTYCDSYSNGKCQIYFLREKENKDKSFVTIEVDKNNKIVQARAKYNESVSDDIMKLLHKWEKTLMVDVK